jgi:hypothetical protein
MASHTAPPAQHLPGLAARTFPRRVRALLQGIVDYACDELDGRLRLALNEYETSLQTLLDQAQSPAVRNVFGAVLVEFRRGRPLLLPAFRAVLEGGVASLREPPQATAPPAGEEAAPRALSLSLVDDVVIDDAIVLSEASNRAEVRNSLALYLLGQRLGVIAGRPAFDSATLPVGPRRLCGCFREAVQPLALGPDHRQLLYKQFDRHVMQQLGSFYDALNDYLIGQQVLPALTYVPFRARPGSRTSAPAAPAVGPTAAELGLETVAHETVQMPSFAAMHDTLATASDSAVAEEPPGGSTPEQIEALLSSPPPEPVPVTRWPGQGHDAGAADASPDSALFDALSSLLESRRSLVGKLGGKGRSPNAQADRIAEPAELQRALVRLQSVPATRARPRPTDHVKQDLLAQLRLALPSGEASALAETDDDAIDLVGLLLEHMTRALRPGSPALPLLQRLQVPLLRVAVLDAEFFTRREHPARQLLNVIADTCEFLSPTDTGDRALLDRMRVAVERAGEYDGDASLFADICADLEHHLQAQARKAEVTERRHVEAALGREKLEGARRRASATLEQLMAGRRTPRFVRTLLTQAWSDVLALALLRGGEDSDRFQQHLRIAERLLVLAAERRLGGAAPISPEEAQPLKEAVESALVQVGYHADDAQAVSIRLVAGEDVDDDDAASSTELALRLKQKVRLGAELALDTAGVAALDEAGCAALARIGELEFGTWFEFRQPNGSVERRRLSWYSLASGHCLFVNHRGHKLADCSLRWLASELAHGRAAVLLQPDEPAVDRAWGAIMRALHSFADTNDRGLS